MDEYEKIEEDLQKQYDIFVEKFRNLCFLESQLDEYHRLEQERFEVCEPNVFCFFKRSLCNVNVSWNVSVIDPALIQFKNQLNVNKSWAGKMLVF